MFEGVKLKKTEFLYLKLIIWASIEKYLGLGRKQNTVVRHLSEVKGVISY